MNPNQTGNTQAAETVKQKSDVPSGSISGTISDPALSLVKTDEAKQYLIAYGAAR